MSRSRTAIVAVALVVTMSAVSCSGDDDAASDTSTTAAAESAESSTTTTAGESDVTALLTARLTDEFGDAEVANAVVANLDPTILAQFEAVAPPEEIPTAPILSYRTEAYGGPVDSLVVLSFGNRIAPDGTVTAGPTNEALADAVQAYVAEHPTPVYAQWEVARILQARGVPDVVSIEPEVGPDGQPVYLSTSGVTDQIVATAEADGVDLGTVGVVAFGDHLVRSVMAAEASGMTQVVVVEGIELPTEYDPESGQEWTRDRVTYLTVDLSGRLATL